MVRSRVNKIQKSFSNHTKISAKKKSRTSRRNSKLSQSQPQSFIRKSSPLPKKSISQEDDRTVLFPPLQLYRAVLIGKPNVGKSSLFNALTSSDSSIITRQSGTTRDSVNRVMKYGEEAVMLSDLPGWDQELEIKVKSSDAKAFEKMRDRNIIRPVVLDSLQKEIESSDIIIAVIDITDVTIEDQMVLRWLKGFNRSREEKRKKKGKPILYCANKCDDVDKESNIGEIYEVGAEDVILVSSKMKKGLEVLKKEVFLRRKDLIAQGISSVNPHSFIQRCDYKLAIVGKPNAGKSSLFNAFLHKNRSVISEAAGTTRDLVEDYLIIGKHSVKLIDTGGLRRKSRPKSLPETYSVEKAVHAINQSEVVILVIDAVEGISDQDKKIAALALGKKKSLVLAFNKWDLIEMNWETYYRDILLTYPPIKDFPIIPISCANRKNLVKLLRTVNALYQSRSRKISIVELNSFLKNVGNMRDLAGGSGVRVHYAMQVQNYPPVFYIYVNHLNRVKNHFRKYLYHHLENFYNLKGTPLTLRFFEHRKRRS